MQTANEKRIDDQKGFLLQKEEKERQHSHGPSTIKEKVRAPDFAFLPPPRALVLSDLTHENSAAKENEGCGASAPYPISVSRRVLRKDGNDSPVLLLLSSLFFEW